MHRRKEPPLPAFARASGTTRRIYLETARWADPPLPGLPGLRAGSPLTRGPHLLALRFPARPQLCAPQPPGRSTGFPPLPRSAQVRFVEGRGKVAPTAASAPALSSNHFGPLFTRRALGTPLYPAHTTHVSPWEAGVPFLHCGCGNILDSRAPGREGGRGSTDLGAEVKERRSKRVPEKRADYGPLRAWRSIPGPRSDHSVTTQDANAFRFSRGGLFAYGEGDRPIPGTEQPAFPSTQGPGIPGLHSLSPRAPRYPSPSPICIYIPRPAPSGLKSLFLFVRWPLRAGPSSTLAVPFHFPQPWADLPDPQLPPPPHEQPFPP